MDTSMKLPQFPPSLRSKTNDLGSFSTTAVDTTVPKVVKKRGGPACLDCKSKKKRCAHRGAEGETEVASEATLAPAPASAMKTRKRQREGTIKVRGIVA